MITLTESGIEFGPFEEQNLFRIEQSPWLSCLTGIKACEFVLWEKQKTELIFVEAKSSVPSSSKSAKEYDAYFIKIFEKFDNSLQLLASGAVGRPKELTAELGSGISNLDWEQTKILFYLVIPKVPDEFLQGLTDKLRLTLRRPLKLWSADAFVINERLAATKGLLNS